MIWFGWAYACVLLVLFDLAKPMLRWYDLWMGVYYDREHKILYMFPLPMLGCAFFVGKYDEQPEEKVTRHYLMNIPEPIYKELEEMADARNTSVSAFVKTIIENGIEAEKIMDTELSAEDMEIIHRMSNNHKGKYDER